MNFILKVEIGQDNKDHGNEENQDISQILNKESNYKMKDFVLKNELMQSISSLKKFKIPTMRRWKINVYLELCDLLVDQILNVGDESMFFSRVPISYKETFINLILENPNPSRFHDSRPILLCCLLYKVIKNSL